MNPLQCSHVHSLAVTLRGRSELLLGRHRRARTAVTAQSHRHRGEQGWRCEEQVPRLQEEDGSRHARFGHWLTSTLDSCAAHSRTFRAPFRHGPSLMSLCCLHRLYTDILR